MALPKTRQHFLTVDGQDFQYSVQLLKSRKDGGFNVHLSVLSAKVKGSRLIVKNLDAGTLQDLFPGQVADLIRQARLMGWQPEYIGPVFELKPEPYANSVIAQSESALPAGELKLVPVISLDAKTTLPTDQVTDAQIRQFYQVVFSDWLADPESRLELLANRIEYAPYVSGGFWLMRGGEILSRPGCCCGLETIFDWEDVLEANEGTLWVGHGTDDYVSFEKGLKLIILRFESRLEILIPIETYEVMVASARRQITAFITRSGPILNQIFEIENGRELALAMIDKNVSG